MHIDKGDATLKAWLDPVGLARSGFRPREINAILAMVVEHRGMLMEACREYFGQNS